MIELEIFIVFFAALFFTLLYVIAQEIVFGILTWACWFALGMMWMFISPMSTGYTIALLFQAIGFLFLLSTVVKILKALDFWQPREESDLD